MERDPAIKSVKWADRNNMMMASVLALALSIAILVLLIMHLYMIFSNMCSVESGILSPWNPFFESYDGTY